MTTSYELSLRLKELGVEQRGLFYWVKIDEEDIICVSYSSVTYNEYGVICRAFTLGEIVRELGKHIEFEILFLNHKHGKEVFARRKNYFAGKCSRTEKEHAPEEAAGELYAETLKQKQ
jgi:hypothetical protein